MILCEVKMLCLMLLLWVCHFSILVASQTTSVPAVLTTGLFFQEDSSPITGLRSNSSTDLCITVTGDKPNLPCVFPFALGGGIMTFNKCFWKDDLNDFICSTKTDAHGNHLSGHSGICGASCPKQCVKFISWPCKGKCISLDSPCDNECPSSEHTMFFTYYLHCDGTCKWTREDGQGFYWKEGQIVDHKYERLCDGVCQDAAIPCHGKCLKNDKFSKLDCNGVCGDSTKSSVYTCNGECISTTLSCNGSCYNSQDNWKCPGERHCVDTKNVCSGNGFVCTTNQGNSKAVCENPAWRKQSCTLVGQIRCQGVRPGQCVEPLQICDGVYDCIDRSDESLCEARGADKEYETAIVDTLEECKVDDDNNIPYTGLACTYQSSSFWKMLSNLEAKWEQQANRSYDLVPSIQSSCFSYNLWCREETGLYGNEENFILMACHPHLKDSENYKKFCMNKTFWDSRPCPSLPGLDGAPDHTFTRCRGNSPGRCFQEDCSCRKCSAKLGCADNSEHICTVDHSFCENNFMWTCLNNETCIHDSLRCDGYVHCKDGSDESDQFCGSCPRSFGFPTKNRDSATYICSHRYTGKPICSVPCDDKDDMCKNMDDENCNEKYYVATFLSIIGIASISIGVFFLIQKCRKRKTKVAHFHMADRNTESRIDNICSMMSSYIFIDSRKTNKLKTKSFKKILRVYKEVHSCSEFSSSLKFIMLLVQTLDETHQREACSLLDKLERTTHRGQELARLRCLKENLGTNQITMKYLTNLEPLGLMHRIKQTIVPKKLIEVKDSRNFTLLKIIIRGFFMVMSYYSDLVKDIVFLIILTQFVPWGTTPVLSFPFQVSFTLFISLVIPQLLNIIVIASNEDLKMSRTFKILMSIFFPFAPAVVVVMRLQSEQQLTKSRFRLMKNYQYKLPNKNLSFNFSQDAARVMEAENHAEKLKNLYVQLKRNENNFENFIQVVVLILILALCSTSTPTVGGLKDLFASGSDSTLYIVLSAIWSSKSLVTGHLGIWVAKKHGFVMLKGKLLLAAYYIFGILSRLLALLFYFAPSMGLFDLLGHWNMGVIPFTSTSRPTEDLIYDVEILDSNVKNIWLQTVWIPLTSYTNLTGGSLQTFYLGLLIFFALHWALVAVLSRNTCRVENTAGRVLDILNTLVCPPPCFDWDDQDEQERSFKENWQKTKKDIICLHFLYFIENVMLCSPIFILSSRISTRNVFHADLFPLLQEEMTSTQVASMLGLAPVGFAVLSALQVGLLYIYYKIGHPWQAIFNLEQ